MSRKDALKEARSNCDGEFLLLEHKNGYFDWCSHQGWATEYSKCGDGNPFTVFKSVKAMN